MAHPEGTAAGRVTATDRRALLGCAAALVLAVVVPSKAQAQGRVYRIGYLTLRASPSDFDRAFVQGMRELGYVEGRNLVIEFRFGSNDLRRLKAQAEELVALNVDVLVVSGPAISAAVRSTRTIPIVMAAVADPVGQGYVASLRRPGGNITGMTVLSTDLLKKRIELLREVVPGARNIAVLAFRTDAATDAYTALAPEIGAATKAMGVDLVTRLIKSAEELPAAFVDLHRGGTQAVIVQANAAAYDHRKTIFALAAEQRLTALYEFRNYVDDGGLLSYGPDLNGMFRRSATYVDKILRGAKPAELAIEQPDKLALVINLKAAHAIGLAIPQALHARAEDVIR